MARADLGGDFRRWDPVAFARIASVITGLGMGVLGLAFYLRADWAVELWPWSEPRMSFVFLASIGAAILGSLVWIGLTGDVAALAATGLNTAVAMAFATGYLVERFIRHGDAGLLVGAAGCLAYSLFNVVVFRWSRTIPVRQSTPTPALVRWSFVAFTGVLVVVGTCLLFQVPHIFPWDLEPATSSLFGCIFLGAAVYFAYGLVRPEWAFAGGQLCGFLLYDLVLFIPYARMFGKDPESSGYADMYGGAGTSVGGDGVNEKSLAIYLAVLAISAGIAIYALLIRPETRIDWRVRGKRTLPS